MAKQTEVAPGIHQVKLSTYGESARVNIPLELLNGAKIEPIGFMALVQCDGAIVMVRITDVSSPEVTARNARAAVDRALRAWEKMRP